MSVLDSLGLPLSGQPLIEASAGTGKTHTICTLVLRLLLGHAQGQTGITPRRIEEILIVTFTRAATEELRGRIRRRLSEAERVFGGKAEPGDDEVLTGLLAASSDREQDRRRLELAALDLDLASVLTIHGFASRMLARHAFESHASFNAEISEDDRQAVREGIRDFWRERVYPLHAEAAAAVLDRWDPALFVSTVERLLGKQDLRFTGLPERQWDALVAEVGAGATALRQCWQLSSGDERRALRASPLLKEARLRVEAGIAALESNRGLAMDELQGLSRAYLLGKLKKGADLLQLALLECGDQLTARCEALTARLLHDAVIEVRARLAASKAQSGLLGYEDLLRLLDEGLSVAGGDSLAAAIRHQYPVALIDEFQDTDPLQWRVFRRIYAGQSGALFLVGDPKQAIYAFRGADVHAYLQVSRDSTQRYSLDTNYRSVAALVAAINALFALRHDGDPFIGAGLMTYLPVRASGKPEGRPLLCGGVPAVPLQILHIESDGPLSLGEYRERIAVRSAIHLAELLAAAAGGEARLGERALRAGDIACLVRNWQDAEALQHELRRRDIPCVYRGRDSVYASPEARDIHQLLVAVLSPGSERQLRAALACSLLGYTAVELDTLLCDEAALLRQQQRFIEYRERLQRLGPQAMLRSLLFAHDAPARIRARQDGERSLTNCLHLLELLQAERSSLDSDEALLARLAQNRVNADGEKESQQFRLESDADRVQIVTLHAAKGLQYPVVYLPFQSMYKSAREPLFHDPDTHVACYALDEDPLALEQAERERIAEDMRLLYVGLTRAMYCCVLGVADTKSGSGKQSHFDRTALGYLLGADTMEASTAIERLRGLPGTCFVEANTATRLGAPAVLAGAPQLSARVFTGDIERDWQATSYSALTRPQHAAAESVFRQPELLADRAEGAVRAEGIFGFPAGARHGSFLHTLLENTDFAADVRHARAQERLTGMLARHAYEASWQPVLSMMLEDVLGCALDGDALRLQAIPATARIAELGFELPLAGLDAARLNRLIDPHGTLPPLGFPGLKGMLSGFIDLVFEYRGRYYLADFKSNLLGAELADYEGASLEAAMLRHRYDVQYLFYTVALGRMLRSRLGEAYDYDTHIGGAYYLFLRGMRREAGAQYGVWYSRPDGALIARLDALFAGKGGEDA